MSIRTSTLVRVLAGWLAVLLPGSAFAEYLPYCRMDLSLSNAQRHVYGTVNTECTFGCPVPNLVHSHKWGNWGVDSNWSSLTDGEQFRGWQTADTECGGSMFPPQWNSCTSYSTPGFCADFNWSGCTEQGSTDERDHAYVSFYYQVNAENGCADMNGYTLTLTNNFMRLFELDNDGNDFVTELNFPSLATTLSCGSHGSCGTTYSGWAGSNGNPVVATEIRLRASGAFVWEDFSQPPIVP